MADSNTGAGNTQESLKQTAVTESKEVFQKQNDGACQRDTEANSKPLAMAKTGTAWASE